MTFDEEAAAKGRELLANLPPADPPKPRVRFRARIAGRFGKGGRPRDAIVWIDKALTFRVRPYKGRKVYEMALEQLAAWAVQRLAMGEARKKRTARAPRRTARLSAKRVRRVRA